MDKINRLKLHLNAPTPSGGRFNHSWNPQRTIKTIAAEARTNECIQKYIMVCHRLKLYRYFQADTKGVLL
jgi:hypothetical protein